VRFGTFGYLIFSAKSSPGTGMPDRDTILGGAAVLTDKTKVILQPSSVVQDPEPVFFHLWCRPQRGLNSVIIHNDVNIFFFKIGSWCLENYFFLLLIFSNNIKNKINKNKNNLFSIQYRQLLSYAWDKYYNITRVFSLLYIDFLFRLPFLWLKFWFLI